MPSLSLRVFHEFVKFIFFLNFFFLQGRRFINSLTKYRLTIYSCWQSVRCICTCSGIFNYGSNTRICWGNAGRNSPQYVLYVQMGHQYALESLCYYLKRNRFSRYVCHVLLCARFVVTFNMQIKKHYVYFLLICWIKLPFKDRKKQGYTSAQTFVLWNRRSLCF